MTTLAEFLKQQAEKERADNPQREKKRREWIRAVERLIQQIEEWLSQADTEKVLLIERTEIHRNEESVGAYAVPGLDIQLGTQKCWVRPVAQGVMAPYELAKFAGRAEGRVDITDGARKYTLYRLVDDGSEQWVIVDDRDYRTKPFDRIAFDDAILDLFQ
jgi:hypothetical protein